MQLFKNFKRKAPAEIALHIFVSAIFMAVALSYIYILVWALLAGLRTHTEIVMDPFGIPKDWNWNNFVDVFSLLQVGDSNFLDMFFNSAWFSVVGSLIAQATTMLFAYCCSFYNIYSAD